MNEQHSNQSKFFTGRIAEWCRKHRRLVILSWVVISLLFIGTCSAVGPNENLSEEGRGESATAAQLYKQRFDVEEGSLSEMIVFSHPTLTVDDEEYKDTVMGLLDDLQELRDMETITVNDTEVTSSRRVFVSTFSHFHTEMPRDESPFVAQNDTGGDVTFASAEYASEYLEIADRVDEITRIVSETAEESGFEILIGGGATMNKQIGEIVDEDFGVASTVNLPLTLIILLIALGAAVAAGVPIILAYLGVAIAAGVITLLSHLVPMMDSWMQIVLLMGLAAGIDYALFLSTRFRAEREAGLDSAEATSVAGHTAGKGVFIAGITTILALLGMFILGNVVFDSVGLAAVISIAVALFMALTLIPALLGNGLNRWNIPFVGKKYNVAQAGLLNPLAGWFVRGSVKYRWIVLVIGLAIMVGLTSLMFNFNLGFNGARSFNDDVEAKSAILALEDNFTLGLLNPAMVVVDPGEGNNIFASDVQEKVDKFIEVIKEENARAKASGEHVPFAEPFNTSINRAGDTELIEIPLNADTGDQQALDAVNLLRNKLIPTAFTENSVNAYVGGMTAGNVDFSSHIDNRTPFVVLFVVITAFLVLVMLYRSILISAIAVFLNLLSVGAAYGLLILVFQEGYALENMLDFEATGIVEVWLPLFVFTVMFGISMDYLTFAIGRVQELRQRGWSTEDSIVEGIRGSFGIVFSAAAIMIAVAAVFAMMRLLQIQQMGFTLAIAVLFDATLILLVLLPAMLRIANDRLWYLPSWLNWLPGGARLQAGKEE